MLAANRNEPLLFISIVTSYSPSARVTFPEADVILTALPSAGLRTAILSAPEIISTDVAVFSLSVNVILNPLSSYCLKRRFTVYSPAAGTVRVMLPMVLAVPKSTYFVYVSAKSAKAPNGAPIAS